MSGLVTAVVGGSAALGATAATLANQKPSIDQGYNDTMQQSAEEDAQLNQWMKDLYRYGAIDPYGTDLPVTPYKTQYGEHAGETGYYYDRKHNTYISQEDYMRESKDGRHEMDPDRFEWVPAELTPEAAGDNSQYVLEQKQWGALNEMFPDVKALEEEGLAAQRQLLPYQTEAQQAQYQYTIDTMPEKSAADIATYQYTQDVMPVKSATDIAGLEEQQRAIEYRKPIAQEFYSQALEGVNPENYMASAGQEMAHQFEKGKAITTQNLRALGVDPSSATGMKAFETFGADRAKAIAASRTAAKQQAEDINFQRLQSAMGGTL